jgi:hypothetical protein
VRSRRIKSTERENHAETAEDGSEISKIAKEGKTVNNDKRFEERTDAREILRSIKCKRLIGR